MEAFGFLLVFLIEDFIICVISLFIFGMVGGIIVTNNSAYLFKLTKPNSRARAYSGLASCIFFGQFICPIVTTPMIKVFGLKMEFLIWILVLFVVSIIYKKMYLKNT